MVSNRFNSFLTVKTLRICRVTQSAFRTLCRVSWRVVCWEPFGVGLIVVAISVVLGSVVHFLLPLHYRQVGWGTFLFIVGSVLSLVTEAWKERKLLKWLRPILVPIVLAAGALLTTQGWNTVNNYKREQALVVEVATEWKLNELRNQGIEFLRDDIQDSNYGAAHLFELPTHWQIARAIDLSRLERSSIKNSPLRATLVDYVRSIDYLCLRLNRINQLFNEPGGARTYPKIVQQTFGKGDAYPAYLETHRFVERILRKNYPGLLDKTDWIKAVWEIRKRGHNDNPLKESDPNKQVDPNSPS